MKQTNRTAVLLVAIAGLGAFGAAVPNDDFVVRRGQTVSYIAFLRYGAYNDSIAALLKADNPQIADLDQVQVGQVLHLRGKEAAPEPTAQRRVLMASRKAVVTLAAGSGEIRRAKGGREPLAANRFLASGDTLSTGPGAMAELIFDNQGVMRLGAGTEVVLTAIQEPRPAGSSDSRLLSTRLSLLRGKTWTHVQKWAGALVAYQVHMPNAVAGVHGTIFENAIAADSSSSVSVLEGEVAVEGAPAAKERRSLAPREVSGPREISVEQWIRILKDGQKLKIAKDGKAGQPESTGSVPDADLAGIAKLRDSL